MASAETPLFVSCDVGTGSARAGIFDLDGTRLSLATCEFSTRSKQHHHYEQSSDKIWKSVCTCIHDALKKLADKRGVGIDQLKPRIKGLSFDATCSLVVLDEEFQPVTVCETPQNAAVDKELDTWNIVLWMDHRAGRQEEYINLMGRQDSDVSNVLKHFGGKINIENEPPKLLWLKRKLPETCWKRAKHFFDLSDYLTFKATGSLTRSSCTITCKWGYLKNGWSRLFWEKIGLEDLTQNGFERIGSHVVPPGTALGKGVSESAAVELNLMPGTSVAASFIDAHAGGVGLVGADLSKIHELEGLRTEIQNRIAVISGTSTCHLVSAPEPVFVKNVWGPFYDGMVPDFHLTEGGQSTTGALLEHCISSHPARPLAEEQAKKLGMSVHDFLTQEMLKHIQDAERDCLPHPLTNLHVLPYHHGDRHPRNDSTLVGAISGLHMTTSLHDMVLQYSATLFSLVYGARHLYEAMNAAGHHIRCIIITGSGAKNIMFRQTLADATGYVVLIPTESESVLLGTAMAATVAAGFHEKDLNVAMRRMSSIDSVVVPNSAMRHFHDKKFAVFLRMYQDQCSYKNMMEVGP